MSEPIISPVWIWLVGVVDNIRFAAFLFAFMLFFPTAFGLGALFMDMDKDAQKVGKKLLLVSFPFFLLTTSIALFTPNSKTLVAMIVAEEITYDRLEMAGQKLNDIRKTLRNDIVSILRGVKCNPQGENL